MPVPNSSVTEHLAHRAVERTVAKRRADYEHEVTRIVEGTFELIGRTGTVDPSMRDILAETGLSTQAFYRYFTSKDELMLALLDDGRRRLVGIPGAPDAATDRRRRAGAGLDRRGPGPGVEPGGGGAHPAVGRERAAPVGAVPRGAAGVGRPALGLLEDPIRRLGGASAPDAAQAQATPRRLLVYRLTFATLQAHLAAGTGPTVARDRRAGGLLPPRG